jgi:hypothetical protein
MLQNIFTMEPVAHLRDVVFALVDALLSDAAEISQRSGNVQINMSRCLDKLCSLTGDIVDEMVAPLRQYLCQFEYTMLMLAREAFNEHCVVHRLDSAKWDIAWINNGGDLDIMLPDLVMHVLCDLCRRKEVADLRYFDYKPFDKCILVDLAYREGFHRLVRQHVSIVPVVTITPNVSVDLNHRTEPPTPVVDAPACVPPTPSIRSALLEAVRAAALPCNTPQSRQPWDTTPRASPVHTPETVQDPQPTKVQDPQPTTVQDPQPTKVQDPQPTEEQASQSLCPRVASPNASPGPMDARPMDPGSSPPESDHRVRHDARRAARHARRARRSARRERRAARADD